MARKAKLRLPFLPKACVIENAATAQYAWGGTAKDATGFQGHHMENQLLVYDEATGIDGMFWEAGDMMFKPPGHAWLCLFNPTDPASRVYSELAGAEKKERIVGKQWHVVRMAALSHPNVEAELRGEPPPVPDAMSLDMFDRQFRKWSQLVGCEVGDMRLQKTTDVVWPPVAAEEYCRRTGQKPRVWRPGPLAEARLLGRFPSQGINSVWSEGDWLSATREGLEPLPTKLAIPEIGADIARFGDEFSCFHVRAGCKSFHHEEANGWDTVASSKRIMELAEHFAAWYNNLAANSPPASRPMSITKFQVRIKVDDDGIGGGVTDQLRAAGYNVYPISAAAKANAVEDYPNKRSELWFCTAERARSNELDLSKLDPDVLDELKREAMASSWSMDSRARRVVCPKDEMKRKLGRSPDGLDAINLSYCEPSEQHADGVPVMIGMRSHPLHGRRY